MKLLAEWSEYREGHESRLKIAKKIGLLNFVFICRAGGESLQIVHEISAGNQMCLWQLRMGEFISHLCRPCGFGMSAAGFVFCLEEPGPEKVGGERGKKSNEKKTQTGKWSKEVLWGHSTRLVQQGEGVLR